MERQKKQLRRRIRKAREAKCWTYREAAEKFRGGRMSRSHWHDIEAGKKAASLDRLLQMLAACGVKAGLKIL